MGKSQAVFIVHVFSTYHHNKVAWNQECNKEVILITTLDITLILEILEYSFLDHEPCYDKILLIL